MKVRTAGIKQKRWDEPTVFLVLNQSMAFAHCWDTARIRFWFEIVAR
jgi:hypothetical protein